MSGIVITSSSLIEIIKACGESGVESLSFQDISLKFYNNNHHNQNIDMALSQDELGNYADGLADYPQQDEIEQVNDNQAIDEEYLAQLSIDDPLAYEELSIKKLAE